MIVVFEAAMLAAFSVGWHISVWKMLSTGRAAGKSLFSVLVVCAGYAFGVTSKILIAYDTGEIPPVIILYAWNFAVIAFDGWLVRHYTEVTENQRSERVWLSRIRQRLVAGSGASERPTGGSPAHGSASQKEALLRRPMGPFALKPGQQSPMADVA